MSSPLYLVQFLFNNNSLKDGDILLIMHVELSQLLNEKALELKLSRVVKCPHLDDNQEASKCSICDANGVHLVKNVSVKVYIPRGACKGEKFIAKEKGHYSHLTNKYGDLVIIVNSIDYDYAVRGPIDRFIGSSADIYSLSYISKKNLKSAKYRSPINNDVISYTPMMPFDHYVEQELNSPLYGDLYQDLISKHKLTNMDMLTPEAAVYQCFPGYGLPIRGTPDLRGKLCLLNIPEGDIDLDEFKSVLSKNYSEHSSIIKNKKKRYPSSDLPTISHTISSTDKSQQDNSKSNSIKVSLHESGPYPSFYFDNDF